MKNRNIDNHDNWKTPPDFYNKLNNIYHFDFDPCPFNHDISLWDGLKIEWGNLNYVNPPYSRKLKEAFILKGVEESKKGKTCVFLLPVSTSTKIFHETIKPNAKSIEFIKGRLNFIGSRYNKKLDKWEKVNYHLIGEKTDIKNNGQHDSMIVVF